MKNETVHNTVYEYRTRQGVTQEELGKAVSVTRQTIFAIEKGRYTPSVALALRLAKYFGVPIEKLFALVYE